MKVAHVIMSGEVAGGQIICERILTALRKRGDDAIVISPNEGHFTDRLREKNIPVFLIPFRKTYHINRAFQLARLLKQEKVDLLHTHAMVPTNVLSRLAAKMVGIPCISHIHAENMFNKNPLIRSYQIWFDRLTSEQCFKLITVSEATKQSLIQEKIPANHIEVILNGIYRNEVITPQICREDILKKWLIPESHHLIGMVGRLSPLKGLDEFFESMVIVHKQISNTTALIVGEELEFNGQYEQKLREQAKRLGLSGNLIFTGYQADSISLINAMDFLVAPSKTEGLPITILEAMSVKKAVVASNVGGIGELVQDEVTGLLVPAGNSNQLAQAILRLLTNKKLIKQMGEQGFLRVKESFTEEKMVNQIFEIYQQALGKSNGKYSKN